MSTELRTRAWVDCSAPALRRNFLTIREAVGPGVGIVPMVKADAYGLGMPRVVETLEPLEPWAFGVAAVEEGLRLRSLGVVRPVLVLSPTPPPSYPAAVAADLSLSVSDLGALRQLREAAAAAEKPGRFHLEVDTGMGRAGFDRQQVDTWAPSFRELLGPPLVWEGTFTHFHSADACDGSPTVAQYEHLLEVLDRLPAMPEGARLHACNSPGALRRPELAAQAVRPGIFLYGGVAGEGLPDPAPVASLRARITFLRDASPGTPVGYGSTYMARGAERWATTGIGYGDGLPRLLSNRGSALVRGRRVPIVGRISMDVTVLDVTGVEGVEVGDVATFFGSDGSKEIPVEEVAAHAGTINYEILTGLTQRVPRIWTEDVGY